MGIKRCGNAGFMIILYAIKRITRRYASIFIKILFVGVMISVPVMIINSSLRCVALQFICNVWFKSKTSLRCVGSIHESTASFRLYAAFALDVTFRVIRECPPTNKAVRFSHKIRLGAFHTKP